MDDCSYKSVLNYDIKYNKVCILIFHNKSGAKVISIPHIAILLNSRFEIK